MHSGNKLSCTRLEIRKILVGINIFLSPFTGCNKSKSFLCPPTLLLSLSGDVSPATSFNFNLFHRSLQKLLRGCCNAQTHAWYACVLGDCSLFHLSNEVLRTFTNKFIDGERCLCVCATNCLGKGLLMPQFQVRFMSSIGTFLQGGLLQSPR